VTASRSERTNFGFFFFFLCSRATKGILPYGAAFFFSPFFLLSPPQTLFFPLNPPLSLHRPGKCGEGNSPSLFSFLLYHLRQVLFFFFLSGTWWGKLLPSGSVPFFSLHNEKRLFSSSLRPKRKEKEVDPSCFFSGCFLFPFVISLRGARKMQGVVCIFSLPSPFFFSSRIRRFSFFLSTSFAADGVLV